MPPGHGIIALMGSGELTATMVEVHKELLARVGPDPKAVFIDTPAGFQLNVDQISQRAQEYFRTHIQHPLGIASFKSADASNAFEAQHAFQTLRAADYILIGPGSPTYAVRQWQQAPVADIIIDRIQNGACLVAASAAALTVGRFTLPVYEIYKVGHDLHWINGMNILAHFGLDLVVIPHWNNAEGGTHDTRFCFMGEPRFRALEALLPAEVAILGLDEHTACIIDFNQQAVQFRGIGRITLRRGETETTFDSGDRVALDVLRNADLGRRRKPPPPRMPAKPADVSPSDSFWQRIHRLENEFYAGLKAHDLQQTANALLECDRVIWQARQDLENEEVISQARDSLRELIVVLGTHLGALPRSRNECLAPLVEELLALRDNLRQTHQWAAADAIRESMLQAKIVIEDTKDGARWRLTP